MVAGGIRESALDWLKLVGLTSVPLLLDSERIIYRHLGLRRSVKQTWRLATMHMYAAEYLAGVPELSSYDGDDLHLMGGDFILGSSGEVLYAYHSEDTRDRPDVSTLLEFVKSIKPT